MNSIPLHQLRAFAAIYETGGIRSAARVLGIAHSAVSRSLRELEAQLDVELVERVEGRRLLVFTNEGEKVGKATLKALRDLERTLDSVKRIKGRTSVVLETTPSLATRWLFPRLGDFERDLPWVELSVSVDQRISAQGELGADLALRLGQGPWGNLTCEPLMDDELIAVSSPSYLASMSKSGALSKCQLLHDRDPIASWSIWREHFGDLGQNMAQGPRYTSGDLVLRAAERGMGVALSRRSLAEESLEMGSLVDAGGGRSIPLLKSVWIVTPLHYKARKPVRKVMEWLRQQCAEESS